MIRFGRAWAGVSVLHHLDRGDLMKQALVGVLSGCLLASTPAEANSLHPCGSIRINNTTFCFLDANGDGQYQEGDEDFCLDGWLTRGGLRCRGEVGRTKPASQAGVLNIRVLTSWDDSCPGSRSVGQINQHLRDGYRIVATKTDTEIQSDAGIPKVCTYTTYALEKR